MHFAAEGSAIAHDLQIVGKGRNLGRKFGAVIIGGDVADELTAHEAKARRRAERAIAIGRVELGTARRQGINIWRFHHLMTIAPVNCGAS